MGSFLDNMEFLTGYQRSVFEQIGAETPLALESTVKANPEAYERFLGPSTLRKLLVELGPLITVEDRLRLKEASPADCFFGVAVGKPYSKISQTPLHEERDRLHSELRTLAACPDQSERIKERVRSVRKQLSVVLEQLKDQAA